MALEPALPVEPPPPTVLPLPLVVPALAVPPAPPVIVPDESAPSLHAKKIAKLTRRLAEENFDCRTDPGLLRTA
jgi:hypothetical protein